MIAEWAIETLLEALREDGVYRRKSGATEQALEDIEIVLYGVDAQEAMAIHGGYERRKSKNTIQVNNYREILEKEGIRVAIYKNRGYIRVEDVEKIKGLKKKRIAERFEPEEDIECIELWHQRKRLGITPAEAAKELGIPIDRLWDIEHNWVKISDTLRERVEKYTEELKRIDKE